MVSAKQLAANRLNAQHSSGPRGEDGKRRSSVNALRHGLTIPVELSELALHLPQLRAWLVDDGLLESQAQELALRILDYERNLQHLQELTKGEMSLPPPDSTPPLEFAAKARLLAKDVEADFTRSDRSNLRSLGKMFERVGKKELGEAELQLSRADRHYRRAANQLLKGLRSLHP